MSDSENDASEVEDPKEKQLPIEVAKMFKAGTETSTTIKEIRQAAESALGLERGFYSTFEWKSRSKSIVKEEVDKPEDEREPVPSSPPPKAIKPTKPIPSKAQKRSPPDHAEDRAPKRNKKSRSEPELESDLEDARSPARASSPEPPKKVENPKSESTKHKTAVKPKAANGRGHPRPIDKVKKGDDNESSALSDPPSDLEPPNTNQAGSAAKAEDSDGELSVLADEDPKPKKKRKSSEATERKPQKTKAAKPKNDADPDPDDAEIKRLQGWLVKCGIRKLWGKELKPYEGSKAKIKHLRSMLADVGMTGRYSIEKATQIKEARELAADIEAVQEGAERWGKDKDKDEPEDDGESKGKRRLVRGAKNYDFLSSDGEETD